MILLPVEWLAPLPVQRLLLLCGARGILPLISNNIGAALHCQSQLGTSELTSTFSDKVSKVLFHSGQWIVKDAIEVNIPKQLSINLKFWHTARNLVGKGKSMRLTPWLKWYLYCIEACKDESQSQHQWGLNPEFRDRLNAVRHSIWHANISVN